MLNITLIGLIILGVISATLLACLHLRLFSFDALASSSVAEFISRSFLHCLVMAGAIALAVFVLLQLRDREIPRGTHAGEGAGGAINRRFITPEFFRNLVAALIAAGYLGLVVMFLNRV